MWTLVAAKQSLLSTEDTRSCHNNGIMILDSILLLYSIDMSRAVYKSSYKIHPKATVSSIYNLNLNYKKRSKLNVFMWATGVARLWQGIKVCWVIGSKELAKNCKRLLLVCGIMIAILVCIQLLIIKIDPESMKCCVKGRSHQKVTPKDLYVKEDRIPYQSLHQSDLSLNFDYLNLSQIHKQITYYLLL